MSSHVRPRRLSRGAVALLFALALAAAGCATNLAPTPPVAQTVTASASPSPTLPTPTPAASPTPTPSPTPRPTPSLPPPVIDGPELVGAGVQHCPGTTGSAGQGSLGSESSSNWSGYAITTAQRLISCVESEWVQPKVKCHGGGRTSVSIWVGLGGFSQSALEQIGTAVDCVSGFPLDYSWHESLPRQRHEIEAPLSVQPGDRIWAQVRWMSGSTYQLSLANLTHTDGFTVRDTNKGLRRTEAVWIAEAPSACSPKCSILSMPDWHKVTFDHIGVTVAGKLTTLKADGSTRVRVRLVARSGADRAVVTSTAPDGSSFVVTWRHA